MPKTAVHADFDAAGVSLYGVFGHPIKHSLSPVIQNAAFAAYGIKAIYLAFNVRPGSLAEAVAAVRVLGMGGVNVTIPHKRAVAAYLDGLAGDAGLCGSVNTIVRRHGRLIGHSTDGDGFVRALREEAGLALAGRKVCILGTGGAALALAVRMAREGVAGLSVVTRRPPGLGLGWPAIPGVPPPLVLSYEDLASFPGALSECDLLVNATPLGMSPHEDDMPPLPAGVFHPGLVVYDLVYRPARTRLMAAAEAQGAVALGGLGMLVHQGAVSFELWTGKSAPVAEMRDAVLKALHLL